MKGRRSSKAPTALSYPKLSPTTGFLLQPTTHSSPLSSTQYHHRNDAAHLYLPGRHQPYYIPHHCFLFISVHGPIAMQLIMVTPGQFPAPCPSPQVMNLQCQKGDNDKHRDSEACCHDNEFMVGMTQCHW
ncbi:hypothetical protein ARMGADRAFT_218694 [Armillaria gallica]|uniref:Uncharacterized protein n=1 Tax=Armillaria gallica TaxID=47427 RepID=A0A2H3DBM7_ARMGA|nr:hypothetical protein ARMGADRAFT_218694 [Armillaria gallica]